VTCGAADGTAGIAGTALPAAPPEPPTGAADVPNVDHATGGTAVAELDLEDCSCVPRETPPAGFKEVGRVVATGVTEGAAVCADTKFETKSVQNINSADNM